jgi:enediyne biosynthesis protein E4
MLLLFLGSVYAAAPAAWPVHLLPAKLITGEGKTKHLPATMPGGIGVFDFDGDGLLDILLSTGGLLPEPAATTPLHLLRNMGGMRFQPVPAQESGLIGTGYDGGIALGDYDGDGFTDVLLLGLRRVALFRHRGAAKGQRAWFHEVTAAAGIDNQGRWSAAAAWFDMDNDADLDLFVGNYVAWDPAKEKPCIVKGVPDFCHPRNYAAQASALFRNEGNGTFVDVSAASGVALPGKAMGVAAADFDGNGYTDLFVTNDAMFAHLFLNQGQGVFVESALERGAGVPGDGKAVSAMGVDAQDMDNDGRVDLIYTALRDESFPLLKNDGNAFVEQQSLAALTRQMSGWGVAFGDLDNDGFKDVAIARGGVLSRLGPRGAEQRETPTWLRNDGTGRFVVGEGWSSMEALSHRGLVLADFNNDGCLDAVLSALGEAARVLQNPCRASGRWLKVEGVRTRVQVDRQWREAGSALSYGSSYVGPLHFGLGDKEEAMVTMPGFAPRKVQAGTTVRP